MVNTMLRIHCLWRNCSLPGNVLFSFQMLLLILEISYNYFTSLTQSHMANEAQNLRFNHISLPYLTLATITETSQSKVWVT